MFTKSECIILLILFSIIFFVSGGAMIFSVGAGLDLSDAVTLAVGIVACYLGAIGLGTSFFIIADKFN